MCPITEDTRVYKELEGGRLPCYAKVKPLPNTCSSVMCTVVCLCNVRPLVGFIHLHKNAYCSSTCLCPVLW